MASGADRGDLEERVRAAVRRGEPYDCAPSGTTADDLDGIDDWDQRVVPAQLLVELCNTDGASDTRVGVRLRGAYIIGRFNLAHADVQIPLVFEVCQFADGVDLTAAHIRSLTAERCIVPTLDADELESDHSIYLDSSRIGPVLLTDARIHGGVYMRSAELTNNDGRAFVGEGLSTTGSVSFDDANVTGELLLLHAKIGGQLSLRGATLTADRGKAFSGDGVFC